MLKNHSILFKIISLLLLIIFISSLSYFLNNKIMKNKTTLVHIIKIIERNKLIITKITLYSGQIFDNEKEVREELTNAVSLYDFTLPVLNNGGIPPEYTKGIILPEPEKELSNKVKVTEHLWEKYKDEVNKIIKEPIHSFLKIPMDTIINEQKKEIIKVKKINNPNTVMSIDYIKSNHKLLFDANTTIISYLANQKKILSNYQNIIFILSIIIYIFISIFLVYFIYNIVIQPINLIGLQIKRINKSKHEKFVLKKNPKEFEHIIIEIEKLTSKLTETVSFINKIKENDFEAEFINFNKNNPIETGLINLRDILRKNAEDEKHRIEEEKIRQWTVNGIEKFNEILRSSTTNLKSLTDAIIKNLVKYLNSSQGGIFIINNKNEDDIFLELISIFAYDRKKYKKKKILIGEGLLGMCALEKNTIWLNKVPKEYMEIESGLGESSPRSLIIVPLKTNTELLGVIEIASLYEFTKNEINFVENIAENISSTIKTTKISQKTAELLIESRTKSKELALQDSKLRIKINELKKAQEIAEKNEIEISKLINAVDKTLLKAELNRKGRISSVNSFFLNKTNYHDDELINKDFSIIMSENKIGEFKEIIRNVSAGKVIKTNLKLITKNNKKLWLMAQFIPVKNNEKRITGILLLGNDITIRIKKEEINKKLLEEALNKNEKLNEQEKFMKIDMKKMMERNIKLENELEKLKNRN